MKLIRFLVFVFFLSSNAWSQDYKPMLSYVNEWQFLTCYQGSCEVLDIYYTDGDTIVNNKPHKILDGFHYISRQFLLREEVPEKKVYLTTTIGGNIEEFLLYDFSLEVGDEFQMTNPYSPFPQDGGMFLLYDVQELPLEDGELYKHYFFTPSPGNTQSLWEPIWVEGVGSLSIVTAPGGKPNFDETGELCCSFANGVNIYSNLERLPSCDGTLGTNDVEEIAISLLQDADTVQLLGAEAIESVSVYNLYGQLLEELRGLGNNQMEIITTHFSQGMYIVVAKLENGASKTFKVLLN